MRIITAWFIPLLNIRDSPYAIQTFFDNSVNIDHDIMHSPFNALIEPELSQVPFIAIKSSRSLRVFAYPERMIKPFSSIR